MLLLRCLVMGSDRFGHCYFILQLRSYRDVTPEAFGDGF